VILSSKVTDSRAESKETELPDSATVGIQSLPAPRCVNGRIRPRETRVLRRTDSRTSSWPKPAFWPLPKDPAPTCKALALAFAAAYMRESVSVSGKGSWKRAASSRFLFRSRVGSRRISMTVSFRAE
jgi:hypothetical protein